MIVLNPVWLEVVQGLVLVMPLFLPLVGIKLGIMPRYVKNIYQL